MIKKKSGTTTQTVKSQAPVTIEALMAEIQRLKAQKVEAPERGIELNVTPGKSRLRVSGLPGLKNYAFTFKAETVRGLLKAAKEIENFLAQHPEIEKADNS
jgi:hypothetical protein